MTKLNKDYILKVVAYDILIYIKKINFYILIYKTKEKYCLSDNYIELFVELFTDWGNKI